MQVASFISGLSYHALPDEVRHRAKLLILDTLGCALRGARAPESECVLEVLVATDQDSACTAWGQTRRFSGPSAALINGTAAAAIEMDDVHLAGLIHGGAVVLPSAVAASEMMSGLSGQEFLAAVVAGYEVAARVGMCMGVEHRNQGWHPAATAGVFGAAAAASRGFRLSPVEVAHALGIAGTQSAGLMAAQFGAMVKRVHTGLAARNGLFSALLARAGLTGIADVFETPYGSFCTTFSASPDRFQISYLASGLGERFEIMNTSVKFYPSAASTHTGLDAVRALQEQHGFAADDIARIDVHGSTSLYKHVGWDYRPDSVTAAQMNLQFCISTLLLEGGVTVDHFTPEAIAAPNRLALAKRVKVMVDPEIDAEGPRSAFTVRVEALLRDGTRLTRRQESARGNAQAFASEHEIVEKFYGLACPSMSRQDADQIRDRVLDIDQAKDMGEVAKLLAKKP